MGEMVYCLFCVSTSPPVLHQDSKTCLVGDIVISYWFVTWVSQSVLWVTPANIGWEDVIFYTILDSDPLTERITGEDNEESL